MRQMHFATRTSMSSESTVCTVRQYRSALSDQPALEIRVRI